MFSKIYCKGFLERFSKISIRKFHSTPTWIPTQIFEFEFDMQGPIIPIFDSGWNHRRRVHGRLGFASSKRVEPCRRNCQVCHGHTPGGQFHPTFFTKQKDFGKQCLAKNGHSILPTIKSPDFRLKYIKTLPNLVAVWQICVLIAKRCLTLFCAKKHRSYFGEILPGLKFIIHIRKILITSRSFYKAIIQWK